MNDYSELQKLTKAAIAVMGVAQVDISIAGGPGQNQAEIDAVTAFMATATPVAVLDLIAENVKLKAENEALKKDADLFRSLVAGVESGRFTVAERLPGCTAYLEDRAAIEFEMRS